MTAVGEMSEASEASVEARARRSMGASGAAVYELVARALRGRHAGGGVLLDVGCGAGNLWPRVRDRFGRYVGTDVVRYDGFPSGTDGAEFVRADLDAGRVPLPDGTADVVAAVETIEHLENPRAFVRELTRLAKPGGWVVVTTPNQLSLLSKMTLLLRNEFNAFRAGSYPAHLTALLEVDLRRIAAECGWADIAVAYSGEGRVALTPWHYPARLSRLCPRSCSDNVLVTGKVRSRVA
jgi:2-polyprenyl-3-methyl-5-hydroxy-6-metoxy-1,4-benzoquinol methylase